MKRTFVKNIKPTPKELAEEFCEMNARDQAAALAEIFRIAVESWEPGARLRQWSWIEDEMKLLGDETRDRTARSLEEMCLYIGDKS